MLNIGIAATAIGLIIGYSTATHINDPYLILLDRSTSTIIIHIQNVLIEAHIQVPIFLGANIELMLGSGTIKINWVVLL